MSRIIETEELISSFILKAKVKYPHISDSNLEKVCRAQFLQLKQTMQSGSLEEVRLQFLFTVRVSPQRIMKQLHYMQEYKDKIRPERHTHYLNMILDYVRKQPIKFRKYGERIEQYTGFTQEQIKARAYIDNGHNSNSNKPWNVY